MMGALPAAALECRKVTFRDQGFALCEVAVGPDELRLFLNDPATGRPLGSFVNLTRYLKTRGLELRFAMNAGMYHPDRRPVGHYVEDGVERAPVVTGPGPGNFGMLPNGIFCISASRFAVMETRRYLREAPDCRHATQSGPMLVIDGRLHPRFLPDSDSRYIRNGVGVSADGQRAVFAISDAPVTFHDFASLFRNRLGLPQALYLDGNISRLHAPGLGRNDGGFPMGPVVAAVAPAQ